MNTSSRWHKALAVTLALGITSAGAATPPQVQGELAIQGVLNDQTLTPAGHRIFVAFSRAWYDRSPYKSTNITVAEHPSARWGSVITIENRNQILFRSLISPAHFDEVSFAAQAADAVINQLTNNLLDGSSPDLAANDGIE